MFSLPSLMTAVLLALAYPMADLWFLAWFALVPLLWALDGRTPKAAFRQGYFSGLVFFLATFYWFIHMSETAGIPLALSLLAVVCLNAYLALYFGLFAWGYARLRRLPSLARYAAVPALWVALEFIRDRFLTGFGWAGLGHSQYQVLPVIQISDITGVFGVSFWIVLVNLVVKDALQAWWSGGLKWSDPRVYTPVTGLALVSAGMLLYGAAHVRALPAYPVKGEVRVALVQGDTAQERKWQPLEWAFILRHQMDLTDTVAHGNLDLIIWPETSFPGYLEDGKENEQLARIREGVKRWQVPLLFGAVHIKQGEYLNQALLMDRNGTIAARYDKMHLVAFGEYIPLRRQLSFLDSLIPIADFTPGTVPALFPVTLRSASGEVSPVPVGLFAALICFEDTVAPVARGMVRAGANMLVNITNDAWFLDRKAPWLHLQAAVFQAVSLRRPLVRAANTGVSCFIGPEGRIAGAVVDASGESTFIEGVSRSTVRLLEGRSFYARYGDVFAYGCLLLTLCGLIITKKRAG